MSGAEGLADGSESAEPRESTPKAIFVVNIMSIFLQIPFRSLASFSIQLTIISIVSNFLIPLKVPIEAKVQALVIL